MREQILDAAEVMVQDRGLNAVSFQHLADAVGLSKPSVFHHFRNKEVLAKALVDRCQTKYGTEYLEVIAKEISAPEKLQAIADLFEEGLKDGRLCLLGTLSNSVTTLSEPVSEELRLGIEATVARFARVFEQGRQEGSLRFEGSPEDASAAFLAMIEGLQVLARARGNADMFTRAASGYIQSFTVKD